MKSPISSEAKPSGLLAIDNGTYMLRAGISKTVFLEVRNRIYRCKDKTSFNPFPQSSVKTMFDYDIITSFDILENTIDQVLLEIRPSLLSDLIFTVSPNMPTLQELLEFLFTTYKFKRIQIGYDFIYPYIHYFRDQNALVLDFKSSSTIIAYISEGRIRYLHKLSIGGNDILEYLSISLQNKYRHHRSDYTYLLEYLSVAIDYNKESLELFHNITTGDYTKCVFLSDTEHGLEKRDRKQKSTANISNNSIKTSIIPPEFNYKLMRKNDEELTAEDIKEKRKQNMIYHGTIHRIKQRIEKLLLSISDIIEHNEDLLKRKNDLSGYIKSKRNRILELKKLLEKRSRLRIDAKNRRTHEFHVKFKDGPLTEDETSLRSEILSAENQEIEKQLFEKLEAYTNDLMEVDSTFVPKFSTADIFFGRNIGRMYVGVELIKSCEILFSPNIVGSPEMGVSEAAWDIVAKGFSIHNVLVCGGFSYISNLRERLQKDLSPISTDLNIVFSKDSSAEVIKNAEFTEILPIYTREDFEKYGAQNLAIKQLKNYVNQ